MCTRKKLFSSTGGTLIFIGLATGDTAAQMRPGSMPVRPMPPAMQPMMPLYPTMGMSNSLSNPWYPYGNMMSRYGNAMSYTPTPPYTGEFPPGIDQRVNDLVVHLPIANGQVWINGTETKRTGSSTRHLSVPAGPNLEVKLKATWTIDGKTKTEERTVHLNGSGRQIVNFLVPQGK
jgi:hypothetical protein